MLETSADVFKFGIAVMSPLRDRLPFIVVLPPDEAAAAFDKMVPKHKALYTNVDS